MSLLRNYIKELVKEAIDEQQQLPDIQSETVIYCDMDGVLVNFEEAVVNLVNRLLDGASSPGVEPTRGYEKRLRKVQEELGPDWRANSRPDLDIKPVRNFMMGAIGANPGPVFAEMKPHLDALDILWPYLTSSGHTVNVLTAPIRARSEDVMSAEEGKELWVFRWLKPAPSSVIMSPSAQKPQYATSGDTPNILIDDKASTITAWNDMGGIGILHVPGGSSATVSKLQGMGL